MPPRVCTDHRLGGVARYRLADSEVALMNVPDEVRKCVAFLQCQSGRGFRIVGTVFFVNIEEEGLHFRYAITAKHVVESIRSKAIDGMTHFRMNLRGGGTAEYAVPVAQWLHHPTDSATDLMVTDFPGHDDFDMLTVPLNRMAATAEVISNLGIGIGDEVFTVGLFYRHYGTRRNIPIVRFGTIAAMPEEPVDVGGQPMEAYLVETRSIGGLSGSPVFTWLLPYAAPGKSVFRDNQIYLLGLMHGHWDLEKALQDELTPDKTEDEPLNTGIGVVVPVAKIVEALKQERLIERRQKKAIVVKKARAPTPDTGN
jgi:hypothetical protein